MSKLSELAAIARAWIQARMAANTREHFDPLDHPDKRTGAPPAVRLVAPPIVPRAKPPRLPGDVDQRTGAPPIVQRPNPPARGTAATGQPQRPQDNATGEPSIVPPVEQDDFDEPLDDSSYDDVELFGRDDISQATMRQVASSNVYAYGFQQETAKSGILYVTFLNWAPKDFGGDGSREGAGPTYAYYDFPTNKYRAFEAEAASSAGSAVWDFCRVRHSAFEHQHTYRLIQTAGDYVPRKVTAGGFKRRNTAQGKGQAKLNRGGFARAQLPEQKIAFRKVLPGRNYAAVPNRAGPNRGAPNRGN